VDVSINYIYTQNRRVRQRRK